MILITGAGGFIGQYLQLKLVDMGLHVMPLYHAARPQVLDHQWECDLTCPEHLAELKKAVKVPKTVIHLAGHVEIALRAKPHVEGAPPLPGKEDISKIYDTNVGATANLLDFCLSTGVRHLIFASSQSVYGMPQSCPLTEETPCEPLEHYAMSKLCCEQLLQVGARQGLMVTILRFPGVFSKARQSGVVFQFCQQAVRAGQIYVKADYPLPLDVIHIEDVVDAFIKAVSWGGQQGKICMNISTGEPCSLNLLAETIASLVPACRVVHTQTPQPIVSMDPIRAETLLGWKAQPQRYRLAAILDSIKHAC
jgi:nucleoside-diphosphate-sugar epimerase